MQGRVFGVHAISLSAKDDREQDRIIEKVKEADMGIIICPSAALSMKQLPMTAPLHNSIAPYVKLREAGVRTYLGVDNVHDLFMPMVDGDIWTEARMLMESTRFYDIDAVAEWACAKPIPGCDVKLKSAPAAAAAEAATGRAHQACRRRRVAAAPPTGRQALQRLEEFR